VNPSLDSAELRAVILALLADRDLREALRHALGIGDPRSHVTLRQFAARWSVSQRLVHYWLRRGLPVVRIGRVVRIPGAQADEWVVQLAVTRGEAYGGQSA
jgi:hypothetical protein